MTTKEFLMKHPDTDVFMMTPGGYVYLKPDSVKALLKKQSITENPGNPEQAVAAKAEGLLSQTVQGARFSNGTLYLFTKYEPEQTWRNVLDERYKQPDIAHRTRRSPPKNRQNTAADILKDLFSDGKDHTTKELKPKVFEAMESLGFTGVNIGCYTTGLAILVHAGVVQRDDRILRASPEFLATVANRSIAAVEVQSNDDIGYEMEQGMSM
jgi:hypothetical protein